jgi:hypothetical protein
MRLNVIIDSDTLRCVCLYRKLHCGGSMNDSTRGSQCCAASACVLHCGCAANALRLLCLLAICGCPCRARRRCGSAQDGVCSARIGRSHELLDPEPRIAQELAPPPKKMCWRTKRAPRRNAAVRNAKVETRPREEKSTLKNAQSNTKAVQRDFAVRPLFDGGYSTSKLASA